MRPRGKILIFPLGEHVSDSENMRPRAKNSKNLHFLLIFARHESRSGQISHFGFPERQKSRPNKITRCEIAPHSIFGNFFIKICSIFSGKSPLGTSPTRSETRETCVSTAIPSFFSNAFLRTTFAVFLPTPGSKISSDIVPGRIPAWSRSRI